MAYLEHLKTQLDIIFHCARGPHEIRLLNQRYQVVLDGQPRDYEYDKGFSIGAPKNTEEAINLVNAHWNKGIPPHNCYIVLNRVSDDYTISTKAGKIGDKWYPAMGYILTKEREIRAYCSLAIDIDRANKENPQGEKQVASEEELAHIKKVMESVRDDLAQFELLPNYCLMSGNGFQIVYFFEEQHDIKGTKESVKKILDGLHEKYWKENVDIDTSLFDPSRVVRLADTWNIKDWKVKQDENRVFRQSCLVAEPRSVVNFYKNIKRLEESLEHPSRETEETRKCSKTYSISQQNENIRNWIDDRLQRGGNDLLICALQKVHASIRIERESSGKPQLLCPYHDDAHASAWIDNNANNIPMIHCKTDTCVLHGNSKTALGVLMDAGWDFKDACRELFGEMPPVQCKYCGKEIIFEGESKRPLNPDHSYHICEEYKTQKKQESVSDKQEGIGEKPGDDGRPTILLEEDLETKSRKILSWLYANNTPPCIFSRGREIVRLIQIEGESRGKKKSMIEIMDGKKFRAFLNERVRFEKEIEKKDEVFFVTADLPLSVADNILSKSGWAFPELMEIIRSPSLDCEGRLILADGYRPGMQAWVDLAGFNVEVPENPTKSEVASAKNLITEDLLKDFPFTDQSSLANTIGLGLLPFVRPLIDGCTPIHLITAPVPGTGKGLLAELLSRIATGKIPTNLTEGRCEEEWRKRITAVLDQSPSVINIDNIMRSLDSSTLSSAITSRIWSDRRLGSSTLITVRNNAIWIVTANNPQLSMEVARRCTWISLDPKLEQPWKRKDFRHDPIRKWVKEQRTSLVKAFLTLAQAWVREGMPKADTRMGSFEEWAEIIGGILQVAGIQGFLTNHEQLCLSADIQMKEWRAFIEFWWQQYQDHSVSARDLKNLAFQNDLLVMQMEDKGNHSQKVKFGIELSQMKNRIIHCWRVEEAKSDTHRHINMWRLVKINNQ